MAKYFTILKRALASFGAHNDTSYAGAIAYNAIFAIFPLLLLAVSLLGFFIHDPAQRQNIILGLFKALGSSVSQDALATQINQVAGGSAKLGVLGAVLALWSASGVFDQTRLALQNVWDSNKPRPVLLQKLVAFAMLFSVGALVLLAIVSMGVLTALSSFGDRLLGPAFGPALHGLFLAGSILIPTLLLFCGFALLYWFVPHAEIRWNQVWYGAAVAAVLFEIVQLLFAYYVANFGHYNQTYGALGGAIAFLFFIYIAANITLFGGEVSKEYTDVVTGMKPATDPKQTGPKQSPLEQVKGMAEGLVIDKSAHHDTSRPYEPGRQEPLTPGADLKQNQQSHPIEHFPAEDGDDGDGRRAGAETPAPDGNRRPRSR